jgi:hypothetical protein
MFKTIKQLYTILWTLTHACSSKMCVVWGVQWILLLRYWDSGFETHLWHGCTWFCVHIVLCSHSQWDRLIPHLWVLYTRVQRGSEI